MGKLRKETKRGSVGERIDAIIDHFKLNLPLFAKLLGISSSTLSRIRSGQLNLTPKMARAMVNAILVNYKTGINEAWLTAGKGKMIETYTWGVVEAAEEPATYQSDMAMRVAALEARMAAMQAPPLPDDLRGLEARLARLEALEPGARAEIMRYLVGLVDSKISIMESKKGETKKRA